jgi:hypothetical protein
MKTVNVKMRGVSPLLMNAYPMKPTPGLDKKTAAEQAEHAAYRDPETKELYVPGVAVQRALVSAATYSKGKSRASLQKPVAASVLVSPERIGLGLREYAIDSRPVVVPATKGRIVRHRPRLDSWEISFTIDYDETLLTAEQLRAVVDDMGSRVGLLDFRPERKGPFGRCQVVYWS